MRDLADIKAQQRRRLHQRAAVPALLYGEGLPDEGIAVTVRWHNKITQGGDLDGDYATIIEGIDRLIFSDSEIAEINAERLEADPSDDPITVQRGQWIEIEKYKGAIFDLDSREPADGPEETVWVVARRRA
jgi:hypothetical protein